MTTGRLVAVGRGALAAVGLWVVAQSGAARAQPSTGEANFTKLCSACHTIGGGRRVGPDLQGVNDRHPPEWQLKWVASSQGLVRSGDPAAVALFHEFNIPMPDVALPPDEIRAVLEYIRGGGQAKAAVVEAPAPAATPEQLRQGEALFRGEAHFTNGGPACSSCHHVVQDSVVGGGVLAKDLTAAFTRLGAPGIKGILHAPPFPVMEQAFASKPLTDEEIFALGGYLKSASERPQSYDQPREDSLKLLFGGLGGASTLMGLYALTWRRRRKNPVNHRVFSRQLRSK